MNEADPSSPIGELRYTGRALDLVRFQADPVDDQLRSFVERTRALGRGELEELRDRLSGGDIYALLTFARRQTVRGLREDDLDAARTAIDALTLATRDRIDYRDLSVDFTLFAVRELGGNLTTTVDGAVERSEPGTAQVFQARREPARTMTLADCALVEVKSTHGIGFMDAWYRTARAPTTRLAEAVVALADLIEADGDYLVGSMQVSTLPDVWFGRRPSGDTIATRGSAGLRADHVLSDAPFSHGLLVFLAELDSPDLAAELVRAANDASHDDRPRSALHEGRTLALFVGGSSTQGEPALETAASLQRFHPLARAVLADLSA